MNWFLIALINPLAHAFANHFDKYLISRFAKESSVGALILFSSLFAVVVLPVLWVINPDVVSTVPFARAIILVVNGSLLTVAILFYLYALESHEASYVAPMFQFIPVFGFIAGYFILGELLSVNQLWAAACILVGSLILSFEFSSSSRFKINSRLIGLMLACCIFYAVNAVIFKAIAVEQGFVDSLFWDMLGKVLFGLVLFFGVASYRRDFLALLKTHRHVILGLNVVSEIISLVGEIALIFAVLFAPVALVQSVGGLQPVFVFIMGVLLTLLLPRFSQESLLKHHLVQKILSIVIISIGVYLLDKS